MAQETNKTVIGAFVMGALVLGAIAVAVFGSGDLFKEKRGYVMFFGGSVKGLRIGAPVQLKGVDIGQVTDIRLVFDADTQSFINRVLISTSPEKIMSDEELKGGEGDEPSDIEGMVNEFITHGLRAKLALQSFVTGYLVIALDFYPKTPATLYGFDKEYQELPTLPSDMEALTKTLENLDLQGMVEKVKRTLDGIESLATSPDLHKAVKSIGKTVESYGDLARNLDRRTERLSASLDQTLKASRVLIQNADRELAPMAQEITGTAADARQVIENLTPLIESLEEASDAAHAALVEAGAVFENLNGLTGENSALIYQLEETLNELSAAARSLRMLTDVFARHPEALIKGKGHAEGE